MSTYLDTHDDVPTMKSNLLEQTVVWTATLQNQENTDEQM